MSPAAEPVLIAAARQRPTERIPVWFMRQAGRSLPEYRQARAGIDMLTSCTMPELVAEITLQPVRRHGVDAAIFFSDIMVPLKAVGVGVEIVAGTGPVVAEPFRTAADLDWLRDPEAGDLDFIADAVALIRAQLERDHPGTALIGFAGAPFTLASYLIEGGPSRSYARTKALMVGEPELWHRLMERLAVISAEFLRVQVGAGAQAVQLFDSWAGSLSESDYREYVAPHSARVLAAVGGLGVPRIHFGVGTGELLPEMTRVGADVIGVDWRIDLDDAWQRVGAGVAVQGNLDPALLGAPWPVLAERVRRVLTSGAATSGHLFNLGHGVPPDTDPGVLTRIVDLVHSVQRSELQAVSAGQGR